MGAGAALITFIIGVSALASSWYKTNGLSKSLLSAIVFSIPYLLLTLRLWMRQKTAENALILLANIKQAGLLTPAEVAQFSAETREAIDRIETARRA